MHAAVHNEHVRWTPLAEVQVDGQRLGRHIVHDERSHDFIAETAAAIKSVLHESQGLALDQAAVGSCTGESLTGAGNSQPNLKAGAPPRTQDDAYKVYGVETKLENQPWPPNDPGGSGLYVCKAGKQLGWLSSYRHAFGIDAALRALVLRPVITGINWYSSFDTPDKDGLVTLAKGAQIRGGHEIVATEIVAEHELVGFWNSWSNSWGLNGRFYMSFSTWDELLQQQGDVTVPYFVH